MKRKLRTLVVVGIVALAVSEYRGIVQAGSIYRTVMLFATSPLNSTPKRSRSTTALRPRLNKDASSANMGSHTSQPGIATLSDMETAMTTEVAMPRAREFGQEKAWETTSE